jgi:glycerol-3-phosphate transporter
MTTQVITSASSSSPEQQDINTIYRYWRFRIMAAMMLGYAGFYLIRQNLSLAIPYIQSDLGYSKTQIGIMISIFSVIYGLGKGLFGLLGDRSNARYLMTFGLFMSAVMNFFMGFSSTLTMLILFWSLSACFQSMGWPPCARLLTHWFSPRELGTKWGLWNSSQQIGAASILILGTYLIEHYGWRSTFFVPAIIAMLLSFFLLNRLRDTPESLGLPPIEEHQGLVSPNSEKALEEERLSMREILFERVLKNKLVWYVSFANFFSYIVRMSVFNWAPTFLREFKGSSLYMAGWQTAFYDIAGIFGGIIAGMLSDRYFKGYRGRVGTILMVALCLSVVLLWFAPIGQTSLHFFCMSCIGFLVTGPQILVGVAASDFASSKAAGAASGFTGTFGYLGAAVTGIGIGSLVDWGGWDYAFLMIAVSAILSAVFFALTWNHRSKILDAMENAQND